MGDEKNAKPSPPVLNEDGSLGFSESKVKSYIRAKNRKLSMISE